MSERPLTLPFDPAGIALDRRRGLSQQLYQALRARVLDGRLSSGTRLPATRDLAVMLALSRNSVVRAYDQLYAEGYIESRVGDGTYVSQLPKISTQISTGLSRGLSTGLSTFSAENTEDLSSERHLSAPLQRLKSNHLPSQEVVRPVLFGSAFRHSTCSLLTSGPSCRPVSGVNHPLRSWVTVTRQASRLCAS